MSNTTPRRAGIFCEEEPFKLSISGANRLGAVVIVDRSRRLSMEGVLEMRRILGDKVMAGSNISHWNQMVGSRLKH